MFIGQVILAGVLGAEFHKYGNALPKSAAAGAVAVICFYVAAFAWSWCASHTQHTHTPHNADPPVASCITSPRACF